MNRSKASTARNAPFGTDVQPKLNFKIVGGKTVEIAVESPPTSAGNTKNLPALQRGPHGTPPLQTQPSNQHYDKESRENNGVSAESGREVYKSPTLIHLSTSPSDKSNSHFHGDGRRRGSFPGANRILPPIPPQGDYNEQEQGRDRHNLRPSHHQSPSLPPPRISPAQPEITLSDQVREHLKDYDSYRFKEMYSDLAEFDRKLTGCVSQAQLNMIAMRNQLPIPTTTLRLLFSNFAKESNPDLINYEKLIQYLARAQLGSSKAETLLQESISKFVGTTENYNDEAFGALDEQIDKFHHGKDVVKLKHVEMQHNQPTHQSSDRYGQAVEDVYEEVQEEKKIYVASKKPLKVFTDRENAKFLRMLEQQYVIGGGELPDLDAMREKFAEKDQQQQGIVTRKQIDEVCLYFRCPVQGSLMDRILQRCDTGGGELSWVTFVDILERAQPLNSTRPTKVKIEFKSEDTTNSQRPTTWPTHSTGIASSRQSLGLRDRPKQTVPAPWESRKPLGRLETRSPKEAVTEVENEITRYDTPTDLHVSPVPLPSTTDSNSRHQRDQLRTLASEHRKKREAQERAAVIYQQQQQKRDDSEPWFDRFMHLARGLYNSDSTNTGFLEREEIYRLIKNYNLIYQLGLSIGHVQSTIASYSKHGNKVPIEHVLEALRHQTK